MRGRPSFFLSCFLSLFSFVRSETHIYSFFCLFSLSRVVLYRSKNRYFFTFAAFRSDHTYTNISWGSPKTHFGVFGASTLEKMLGVGPSMRFFGVATSRLRFGASRSRPELAGARP